jgi:hypothetical protein
VGCGVMMAMARHAWIRAHTLLTSPGHLALLFLAAWSSLWVWPLVPWTVSRLVSPQGPSGYVLLALFTVALWLWSWMAARPMMGQVAHGGRAQASAGLPLPALPIGIHSRVIADAIVALALVLLVRAATLELQHQLFVVNNVAGAYVPRNGSVVAALAWWCVMTARVTTATGSLFALPVLLAWMAPSPRENLVLARSFAVAAIGACVPTALLGTSFSTLPLTISVGLAMLLLSVHAIGGHTRMLPAWVTAVPARSTTVAALARIRSSLDLEVLYFDGTLFRTGVDPEPRLRRDRFERAVRPMLVCVVPAIILLLGALLLERSGGVSPVVYALCLPVAAGLLIGFYAAPFGINVFQTDRAAGSASLLGGAYGRAWAAVPVRPEAVARAVYVHGLASALLAWLIWASYVQLADRLGVRVWPRSLDLSLLLLPILCAAGLLLCAHVGDYWRGMLSALTVFCFLPAYLFISAALGEEWVPGREATLKLGVLLALTVLGGLLLLVHLRRPRRAR